MNTLRGSDWWLYRGLLESLKGTSLTLSLEYNGINQNVKGWPLGVIANRGFEDLPPEEKSKAIWLRRHPAGATSDDGFQLEDSFPSWNEEETSSNLITVACISIHHKTFLTRYGRRKGYGSTMEDWTHYDDITYCD